MPDGDSLNWRVRGTGSRRVLALLRSGTDCKLVTDAAVQMFAKQANKGRWKPAERAYDALEARCAPLTRQAIEEELLCQSARAVVDYRVLPPARDEIAREFQRDSSEQISYERELLSSIGQDAARRLHRAVFVSPDPAAVRTPARRVPKKENTLERLGEVLNVLPGGDQ